MSNWREQVKPCSGKTLTFVGPESETKPDRQVREAEAKSICATCPVRDDCLAEAMRNREKVGVWGGLNPEERRELARALRSA